MLVFAVFEMSTYVEVDYMVVLVIKLQKSLTQVSRQKILKTSLSSTKQFGVHISSMSARPEAVMTTTIGLLEAQEKFN